MRRGFSTRVVCAGVALTWPVILVAETDGPDAAGVILIDSTETDGPPAGWIDMATAEAVEPGSVVLPFAFAGSNPGRSNMIMKAKLTGKTSATRSWLISLGCIPSYFKEWTLSLSTKVTAATEVVKSST